ncbi:cytochrome B2, putative [Talaromyces marneffei ATCC 18224]|uniref:Cytochrome B2, putative n=1 Tax=Talaromyces marneffei (strain ATCC 18224 / CBS 334.59 / QM 7333) TaxID=441960 RepID=B6QIW1_TALMQ|nr:cytochrome B2, putative [Talaromyces marneffei ATCC 18224]
MGEVFEEKAEIESNHPEYPSLEALKSLDEIEELATRLISKEAWAFNFAASGDLISKRLDAEAYKSILLRPRIFVDVGKCDLSTQIMGQLSGLPIFISPMAMARRFHPAGEAGITQACRELGIMHIISNNASMTPEEIVDAGPDQSHGFQLYVQQDRKESEVVLERINKLKAIKCLVLTLDEPVPGKHELGGKEGGRREAEDKIENTSRLKPAVASISGPAYDLTWKDTLEWVTQHTELPIVLKGVQTHEDAYIASQFPQVKSIILSNHAGRVLDTAPPSIYTLLEIRKYCPEVFDKVDVLVDGGIRRGTDVVKAICLGAKGVGIGRSVFWGLGAGGVRGVERTIEIMADEIRTCMRLLGVRNVADLGLQHVNTSIIEQQLYKGPSGLQGAQVSV